MIGVRLLRLIVALVAVFAPSGAAHGRRRSPSRIPMRSSE